MTNDITKAQVCLTMRNGAQIWVDADKAKALMDQLVNQASGAHRFVRWEGELINTADVVGIFKPGTMDAVTRRKNGQWQCGSGTWHGHEEKDCGCASQADLELVRRREEAIRACGKCSNGFIIGDTARLCECQEQFRQGPK